MTGERPGAAKLATGSVPLSGTRDRAPEGPDEPLYPVGHTVADGELAALGRIAEVSVRVTGHVLHRSFGQIAYHAGVPVPTIQRIFGHVSIDQTLHYVCLVKTYCRLS